MLWHACSAFLFDLDGVLVDSTPAVARVWKQWAIEHGFDPEQVIRSAHGRPSISTLRDYLPNADHELENREVERREIEDLQDVRALAGAQNLLSALPRKRWTIVTSCTRRLAQVRLQAAGLPVPERMVTSDDVERGKPDPEPYLRGAERLGFPPHECVVVEDAPAGIRAGRAAGTRVIGLRTTTKDAELIEAGATWIVDDCSAISLLAPASMPTSAVPGNLALAASLGFALG
jgi:sugar-phosphatase